MFFVCRWFVRAVAVLLGVPVLLIVLLIGALNTDPGRRAAERGVARVTAGTVVLAGLAGRFPDALRVARLEVRDGHGTWLTVENADLDWMPSRLFGGEAGIARLTAENVTLARLPAQKKPSSGANESLPVPIVIDALRIGRLGIPASFVGAPAVLSAEGSGRLDRLDAGSADLTLHGLDAIGTFRLRGSASETALSATLDADEPAHGLVGALAKLPEIGALALHASARGKWSGLDTHLALAAGALSAKVDGRIDVPGKSADLDVAAHAPAMAPRADVAWASVQVDAHVHGPWTAPHARGTVAVDGLTAAGASLKTLSAKLAGDYGGLSVDAAAEGLRMPGSAPDLFAATPVTLHADARLDVSDRPVTFALTHSLLSIVGEAQTSGEMRAKAHLAIPDLSPFVALGTPPIAGHAALDVSATRPNGVPTLSVDGIVGVTGGPAPLPALVGPAAHLAVAAALHGDTLVFSTAEVDGRSVTLAAHGSVGDTFDISWKASLPDVSVVANTVQGDVQAHGRADGAIKNFAIEADLSGNLATAQTAREPIRLKIAAHGLPDAPSATIAAEGSLDRAPLTLDAAAERASDGTLHLAIARAGWKSFSATGELTLAPAADFPAGRITLRMDRLADLSRVVGQPVGGSATAELSANGKLVRLQAAARGATIGGAASAATTVFDLRVRDPLGAPSVDGSLDVSSLNAGGIGGAARLEAKGPVAALALQLRTSMTGLGETPLVASAAARIDGAARTATVAALQADWQGQTLRLLAPARLSYADGGFRIDGARLGLRDGILEVAGKFSPALDLTAKLRNLPADVLFVAMPQTRLAGVVQADVKLTGPPTRPDGRLHLSATGLHLRSGPGAAMPAASLVADATLAGGSAHLTAKATAGHNAIGLTGSVPLDPGGAIDLQAAGSLDLAVLNPLLAGAGRRVRGTATLNGSITGSLAQPLAGGTLLLADGDAQDFVAGVHISGIAGRLEGAGDTLHLVGLSGRAGTGDISASGTIGLAGGWPADLAVSAKHARPLASDLLTAQLDLDLALRGDLLGRPTLSGTITVDRTDIRVPERLPAQVAVLEVRRPGQKPPRPGPGPELGLAVTLHAPGLVFVRGRGVDAELQGNFDVTGSTDAPDVSGRLTLRRGTFNLAGQTLNFTSGTIGFEVNPLDPTLNLVASSSTPTVTATLTVTGTASAPKLTLSSVPDLPQDEILAQLLFHQSTASLSVLQLASSAAALAQLSGVGSGFDPLGEVRQGLGLDRLSVGSAPTGNGAALEAGRYVASGIYLGARQGTGDTGSQATVQIDLTRNLKLQATAGTGGDQSATGAASTDDPNGSSIGLTYQFNY